MHEVPNSTEICVRATGFDIIDNTANGIVLGRPIEVWDQPLSIEEVVLAAVWLLRSQQTVEELIIGSRWVGCIALQAINVNGLC
jgi:hypothetical protein